MEPRADDMLLWTWLWLPLCVCLWLAWRRSKPRKLPRGAPSSPVGQGLRLTYTPISVTLEMLKKRAIETSSVADLETQPFLRRVKATGLQLVEAQLLYSQLRLTNLLGEGTFGKVFQIKLADVSYPICIKLAKGVRRREYNLRECELMACLQDLAGVPRVLGISVHPDGFIMTMHGRRTLAKCTRGGRMPSECILVRVLQDLASVLASIHRRGFCHNDLKSNNVMVEMEGKRRFSVTLIDFGLMSRHGCYPFRRHSGNLKPFYDPELMRREKPCSEATDMYSMGYLMRVILVCFPTVGRQLRHLCARAMGPATQRPPFSELEDALSKL